ncbi:SDR family oxidoreductase [Aerococcus urinaeequi]|uniref:SDR family oxidoreductase n=1 Tax=Aerococcus urinaeequi TaxID=51665 RepID=UPI003AAE0CD7
MRVNGVAPGAIATNIASTMTNLSDFGNAQIGAVSSLNPGVGQFEDIANAAVFLASDDAKFIIGYIITVNDGFTAPF